jgi:hypothetical protein
MTPEGSPNFEVLYGSDTPHCDSVAGMSEAAQYVDSAAVRWR